MITILLRLKRRIKKLLKAQTESRQQEADNRRSHLMKMFMLAAVSIMVGVLYPGEVLYDPLDMPRQGEFASEDILAPFQITIYKDDRELADEEELIRFSIPFVLSMPVSSSPTGSSNFFAKFCSFIFICQKNY